MEEQQGFPAGRAMFMHASQAVVTSGQITVPGPGERLNGQQQLREKRVCVEVLPAGEQKLWSMGACKKWCCELPEKERN